MKSVLAVLGIAILALVLAVAFGSKKSLTPTPQEDEEARRQYYEKLDAAEAAKSKPLDLGKNTSGGKASAPSGPAASATANGSSVVASKDNPQVVMTIADRGKVTIELYQKDAPKTVAHFLGLVNRKFYDGILFHRVRPGFVAQAGDPASRKFTAAQLAGKSDEETGALGLGAGGSGPNGGNSPTPFESNSHTHEVGTLALALSAPRSDTGDSQFFVNLAPNHNLDGDYCVFGHVVSGMDVVNKMQQGDKIASMVVVKGGK